MKHLNLKTISKLGLVVLGLQAAFAQATGVVPQSPLVYVDAGDGEGTMKVQNTDDGPRLLQTTIYDLPEDKEHLVVATPPVARVEAHQTQVVRFIVDSSKPITTERLKRVTFEGLLPADKGKSQIQISIRQDLPLLIHPEGLPKDEQPWKRLVWSVADGKLNVSNDSPYVVRLDPQVVLLPVNKQAKLSRSYVLPGEHIVLDSDVSASVIGQAKQIKISPSSAYGYVVDDYIASLTPASVAAAAEK